MAMSRFRTLMLSIGILCVLTGCGVSIPGVAPPNRAAAPPPMQAATPLDAARMNTSDPNNRRVLAQRPLEDKVIVFYREPQPIADEQTPAESFWYTVTGRQGIGWSARGSGMTSGEPRTPDGLTEYGVLGVFSDPDEDYAVVMGETRNANVAAVAVKLAKDDVVRGSVADGAFVVIAPQGDVAACELRLLAEDDTVQQTLPLPNCER